MNAIEKVAEHLFYDASGTINYKGDVTWGHLSTQIHLEWMARAERLVNFIPELALVDREAALPSLSDRFPPSTRPASDDYQKGYYACQEDMKKWVKEATNE